MSPLAKMLVGYLCGYAAQNLGLLRRLSVSLLKQVPSKQSLKMKRYRAGMDNNSVMEILAASAGKSGVSRS
ncbi:hypothetical protein [Moorena sp. SIO1F2]|uniref:hypothetical protein n=1 Tax=Moorena sp. SIO1F2 TaxID=2607819 RepID=UPI0025CFD48E|nr:hypothetical protein [Moorena sp. SIO1F2]